MPFLTIPYDMYCTKSASGAFRLGMTITTGPDRSGIIAAGGALRELEVVGSNPSRSNSSSYNSVG